ncbi:MAG: hypothetical protein P8163_15115 [Candidatus Thiodiazotropha sp.]
MQDINGYLDWFCYWILLTQQWPWFWRIAPIDVMFIFWLAYKHGGQAANAGYTTVWNEMIGYYYGQRVCW